MYNVPSGEIQNGILYLVAGDQSLTYNGIVYNTGERFRGGQEKTFIYSGTGSQALYELTELRGFTIEFLQSPGEAKFESERTEINGFAIEFELNEAEKIVQEITEMKGFAIELIDFPIFAFTIFERRL